MKVKVIGADVIDDVIEFGYDSETGKRRYDSTNESGVWYYADELEFLTEPSGKTNVKEIEWEQRRYELTKTAMAVIYDKEPDSTYSYVAERAIMFADAVIEKLKEKQIEREKI